MSNLIHPDTITVPIELKDGWPYRRSGSFGEEKNLSNLPEFGSHIV